MDTSSIWSPLRCCLCIMVYNIPKEMVCLTESDTHSISIVTGVLQGDTSAQYMLINPPILHTSNLVYSNNSFELRGRETDNFPPLLWNVHYADTIALLGNTTVQTKYLLLSLELVAGGSILFGNANKTESMCFQWGTISTFIGGLLELINKFTYLACNTSFIGRNITIS